jgi:hypothetical protein
MDRAPALFVLALAACHPASTPVAAPVVDARDARPMPIATDAPREPSRPPPDPEPADAIQRLPCSEERLLRSGPSERSLDIGFVNVGPDPVVMYWLGFDGARVAYARLAPQQAYRQQTYLTHPWLVSSPKGNCLAIFLPVREDGRLVVRVGE